MAGLVGKLGVSWLAGLSSVMLAVGLLAVMLGPVFLLAVLDAGRPPMTVMGWSAVVTMDGLSLVTDVGGSGTDTDLARKA